MQKSHAAAVLEEQEDQRKECSSANPFFLQDCDDERLPLVSQPSGFDAEKLRAVSEIFSERERLYAIETAFRDYRLGLEYCRRDPLGRAISGEFMKPIRSQSCHAVVEHMVQHGTEEPLDAEA